MIHSIDPPECVYIHDVAAQTRSIDKHYSKHQSAYFTGSLTSNVIDSSKMIQFVTFYVLKVCFLCKKKRKENEQRRKKK